MVGTYEIKKNDAIALEFSFFFSLAATLITYAVISNKLVIN